MKNLFDNLKTAATEEEVKFIFAKFFNLKISTKNYIDLYTPQILLEFKFDNDLNNLQHRAKIFAQALYYVRRLKYGLNNEFRALTNFICVVTKNSAALAKDSVLQNCHVYNFKISADEKNFTENRPC